LHYSPHTFLTLPPAPQICKHKYFRLYYEKKYSQRGIPNLKIHTKPYGISGAKKGMINLKLWGGRFTKSTDSLTDHFHSSISFDKRMYKQDIKGSIAHARMLAKQGIISDEDAEKIADTLEEILTDIEKGIVTFDEQAEDIHMNIEKILTARIGEAGKRLHTGRSRNDQVALDIRMYVKEEITQIKQNIFELIAAINSIAKEHVNTIMPGYTHLQRAQPVSLAHHILAYAEMLKRDISRLNDTYRRTDVMPLGSGALATTTYPLDRKYTAKLLGFSQITLNSMDGVSDRDFLLDLLSALSILMMHLSRFCEEIILWASFEFKYIELDDAYSTGSSIMPQKKNPDMAELIRGKTGRVYGNLMGLLTVMKGLPLAYNKDMQEDKESVFDTIDTVEMVLPVFTNMLKTAQFNKENMYKAAGGGFTNATDAADWLVKNGVAFRDAHEIIGKLVIYCINQNISLEELSLEEFNEISPVFNSTVYDALNLQNCVNARTVPGGPSESYIRKLIEINENYLKEQNYSAGEYSDGQNYSAGDYSDGQNYPMGNSTKEQNL
jgi:argininosuccinate lyase